MDAYQTSNIAKDMVKPRSLLKLVLGSNDSFDHVQFHFKNDEFVAITSKGRVYSGDILLNKISVVYNLEARCEALLLFSKHEETLALIALQDGSLVTINIDTKKMIGTHPGFGHAAKDISIHPWSARVITTFHNSGIVWDISNGIPVPLHKLNYPGNAILLKVFFGPNGDNIITCFANGNVIAWDFPSLEYQTQLPNPYGEIDANVEQVAVSDDATFLLSLTSDAKLFQLDLVGKTESQPILNLMDWPSLSNNIKQAEILNLGLESSRLAVFLIEHGNLIFFDLVGRRVLMELKAKSGKYTKFAVPRYLTKPNLKPVAVISNNGNLEILNVATLWPTAERESRPKLTKSKNQKTNSMTDLPTVQNSNKDNTIQDAKPSAKADVKKKPQQIIRLYEFENMLLKFGEFPAKYRTVIWKEILRLPLNRDSFSTLLARELHPAFINVEEKYPVTNAEMLYALKRILSSLAHWCALFAEVSYLPILVFPFVKVFYANPLICFEIVMTYLVHWCHDWFQYYPAPPYHIFAKIENILEKSSPKLLFHFKAHGITGRDYAWPLLESSFSEVFTLDDFLRIFDHIFTSQDPNFLYSLVVAYATVSENTLLRCTKLEEFQKYFHNINPVSVKIVLEKAKQINSEIAIQLQRTSRSADRLFVPLPDGTYPVFFDFPMAAVKSHAYQMQKIRQMESEYLKERKTVLRLEAEYGSLYEQEEEWKRRDAILRAADYMQKQEAIHEEQRLQDQRTRLQILKRQLKMKEAALMDSKKRQLQREYEHRSKAQVTRLEDTTRWIATLRQTELVEANAEAELRHFKQKMEKCAFEIDLLKEEANISRKVDDCLHRLAETDFNIESALPQNPYAEGQLVASDNATIERDNLSHWCSRNEKLFPRSNSLEEQLIQLEKSNKNMEMQLKEMMSKLATDH